MPNTFDGEEDICTIRGENESVAVLPMAIARVTLDTISNGVDKFIPREIRVDCDGDTFCHILLHTSSNKKEFIGRNLMSTIMEPVYLRNIIQHCNCATIRFCKSLASKTDEVIRVAQMADNGERKVRTKIIDREKFA